MMNEAVGYFSDAKGILFWRLLRSPSVAPASIGKVASKGQALGPHTSQGRCDIASVGGG